MGPGAGGPARGWAGRAINFSKYSAQRGPAHRIFKKLGPGQPGPSRFLHRPGPARPGPSHFQQKTRPGPTRPITFFTSARPGPAHRVFKRLGPGQPRPSRFLDRPGPARPGPVRPGLSVSAHDKPCFHFFSSLYRDP